MEQTKQCQPKYSAVLFPLMKFLKKMFNFNTGDFNTFDFNDSSTVSHLCMNTESLLNQSAEPSSMSSLLPK